MSSLTLNPFYNVRCTHQAALSLSKLAGATLYQMVSQKVTGMAQQKCQYPRRGGVDTRNQGPEVRSQKECSLCPLSSDMRSRRNAGDRTFLRRHQACGPGPPPWARPPARPRPAPTRSTCHQKISPCSFSLPRSMAVCLVRQLRVTLLCCVQRTIYTEVSQCLQTWPALSIPLCVEAFFPVLKKRLPRLPGTTSCIKSPGTVPWKKPCTPATV